MEAMSSVPALAEGQRNKRGQWVAGVSGNRSGRPRKKVVLPQSLTDHFADAMMEKIPVTGGDGKQEMVPAYEAAVRLFVGSLLTLKPKELLGALQQMEKLGVYGEMRRRAGNVPEQLTLEQTRERVKARLKELIETQPHWLRD